MYKPLLKYLLLAILALGVLPMVQGQRLLLKRTIMPTDTLTDEEGNAFVVSHDDAEQENDEIDTLTDDDIDSGWEGDPEDQNILTAGLRFRDIQVPQGATIDSAFVVVYSHEGKDPEDVAEITIWADATDDAPTFTEDSLITDRSRTGASVLWTVAEEWEIYQPYRTVNIAPVIQEVVGRPGWAHGNAIALVFEGRNQGASEVDNAREWEAFENIADPEDGGDGQNHPERVAQLWIYYSAPSNKIDVSIAVTDTLTDEDGNTFAVSTDDGEQENDEIDTLTDDDIDAGWEGDPEDQNILTAGLRFIDLQIPQGATIDSSYIIVFSHEGKDPEDVAEITIVADASDNAPTFTEDSLFTDRAQTEDSVLWVVAEEWEIYQPYRTADLSPVVQEIVNRPGWQPGNAMAFIFKGRNQGASEVDNAREWEAFENIADPEDGGDGQNHPERVARLVVYWTLGDATPVKEVLEVRYNSLAVYPNPVDQNLFTLELPAAKSAQISLINQNGQTVKTLKAESQQRVELATDQLPGGIYYLQVVQDQHLYTQKLMILHP